MPNQRVFALIIAIDTYKSPRIQNLRECIADSALIRNYILETFGPHNDPNIRMLRNEQATRDAIISNLRSHLIDNPKIQPEDPIIFFFAGHGTRTMKPLNWESNTNDMKIEALCPYDEDTVNEKTGQVTRCIPDLTFGKLLRQVSVHGHKNLTVILDCCHSGGGTRQGESEVLFRARDALPVNDTPFPGTIDRAIWELPEPEARSTGRNNDSEILLAACDAQEKARDGYFTRTLVKQLQARAGLKTTISDLGALIPATVDQHPICLGHPNKILFTNELIDTERRRFVLRTLPNGKFEVNAGSMHGITAGALFKMPDGKGTLEVESTKIFTSTLKRTPSTADVAISSGTKVLAIPSTKSALLRIWPGNVPFPSLSSDSLYKIVPDASKANLLLSLQGAQIHVELREPLLEAMGCSKTRFDWSSVQKRLPDFLDTIALFRYQLGRSKSSQNLLTSFPKPNAEKDKLWRLADAMLYRIGYVSGEPLKHPLEPQENLFKEDGVAKLKNSEENEYGIRLVNKSKDTDLYFYVFYFNPMDFSIEAWSDMNATRVRAKESLTIGYGAGGHEPVQFTLDDAKRAETGFFKVFVATQPVEGMQSVEQGSAGERQQLRKAGPRDIGNRADWGVWIGAVTVSP